MLSSLCAPLGGGDGPQLTLHTWVPLPAGAWPGWRNIFPEETWTQIVPKVRVAITVHAHRPLCPCLCKGLLGGPGCPTEGRQP